MKLTEALARDLPLLIGLAGETAYSIAYAWELRKGGLVWVNGGHQMSPSKEAHVVEGTIEGEGPWLLTARNDPELRLEISQAREHVAERGDPEACLSYVAFWYDHLRKADLVL